MKNILLFILCILVCTSHADQSPPEIVDGRVCIDTEDGYTYFVQSSIDMVNFSYVGTYEVGVKGAIYEHLLDLAQNLGFVTYEIAPTNFDNPDDTDGDGLSNLQELNSFDGVYSPTNSDTDGNGVGDGDEDYEGDGVPNKDDTEPLVKNLEEVSIAYKGVTRSGNSENNLSYEWLGSEPDLTEEVDINKDLGGWVYEDITAMNTGIPEPYSLSTATSAFTTYKGNDYTPEIPGYTLEFTDYSATTADYLIRNTGGIQDYDITRHFIIRTDEIWALSAVGEPTYEVKSITIPAGLRDPSESSSIQLRPQDGYAQSISLLDIQFRAESDKDISWDTGNSKKMKEDPVLFNLSLLTPPNDPCAKGSLERGLVLAFDECFNYEENTYKDIEVSLSVGGLDDLPSVATFSWTRDLDLGEQSGLLSSNDKQVVTFNNPTNSGRYVFSCDVNILGTTITNGLQVICPEGGPDITNYVNQEIARYDEWARGVLDFVNNGSLATRPLRTAMATQAYIETGNDMDHGLLHPEASSCPCQRINFGLTTGSIEGYVFKMDWVGNIVLGYVMEIYDPTGIGVNAVGALTEFITLLDGDFVDDPEDRESYRVGASIANGTTLKDAIETHDIRLMQKYPSNVLWPCIEKTYTPPQTEEFSFPTHTP